MRACGVLLLAVLACGCATSPPGAGFPASMPPVFADERKAIAIVGDLQMTPWLVRRIMRRESTRAAQRRLIDDLIGRSDDLGMLAIAGDLVFTARSARDWRHFDGLLAPIASRMPVLPAIGNHDYDCMLVRICRQDQVPRRFLARFPWFVPGQAYVVPYGDLVLVFIDSETGLVAQGAWLREQLAELERRFAWALIVMHRPPYTDSLLPDAGPNTALQEQIVAALADTALMPVVVSGHAHGYEHQLVDGIHFVVSAGGGGPRGKLKPDRPADVYAGRDCVIDRAARVTRPFNYLLVRSRGDALEVTVRGFCKADAGVATLESFEIGRRSSQSVSP